MLKESIDTSIAKDEIGLTEMLLYERLFMVENCTPVLKIESGGTLSSMAEIRIIEYETYGLTPGLALYEFAVKTK